MFLFAIIATKTQKCIIYNKPAEQFDVVLAVVWLERRPLVDQRDWEVFGQVVGVTWNQACPDKHEDTIHY